MHNTRKITEDIYYVGGSDRRLTLFENIFPIPRGVSYNAYLLMDEKTVLLDAVDSSVGRQFLENIAYVLGSRSLDYMVINHMEPDHCALLEQIILRYPKVKLIGNAKTFQMVKQFFDFEMEGRSITVKEGDRFLTGKHNLSFVMAPMVHWPEVMVTYDPESKILFSADAFGTFGALNGAVFTDEIEFDKDWQEDARRYYSNIVGKYGTQVQALLKKVSGLDIQMICPLHGPVWRKDISFILDKYIKWSTYEPEEQGVLIIYASMYGNTENAADILAAELVKAGVKKLAVYDVSGIHMSYLVSEVFKYSHLVIVSPTYNAELYPVMDQFVRDLKALNVQNRKAALVESGTWALSAAKKSKLLFEEMKNITILEPVVSVKSSVKESDRKNIEELAGVILKSM